MAVLKSKKGLEPVIWTLIVLSLIIISAALYLGFIKPALSQSASLFGKTTVGSIGENIEDIAQEYLPEGETLTGEIIQDISESNPSAGETS